MSVFLPHPTENQQIYSGIRIEANLCEHGVEHCGPIGAPLAEIKTEVSKKEVIQWAGSKGCPRSKENKRRISLYCLQGLAGHFLLLVTSFRAESLKNGAKKLQLIFS